MIAIERAEQVSSSDIAMLCAGWERLLVVEAGDCIEIREDRTAQLEWLQRNYDVPCVAPMPRVGQSSFEFHVFSGVQQKSERTKCIARLAMSAAHFPSSSRPLVLFATGLRKFSDFEDRFITNETGQTPNRLNEFFKTTVAAVLAKTS